MVGANSEIVINIYFKVCVYAIIKILNIIFKMIYK